MRPIFIIVGLVLGAFAGAAIGANYGADYIYEYLSFESPDGQGNMSEMVFFGSAVVFALVGALLGWLVSLFFKSSNA